MIKKIPFVALIIFLLLLLSLSLSYSIQQVSAPDPPNVTIEPPDSSLPAEAKLLTGKWAGQWTSRWGWDCVLYVEKVNQDSAQVVHAWGEYNTAKMSCHCDPNWARVQKAKVTYRDGKAVIEFITPNYQSGHFKKKRHLLSGEDEGWVGRHPKSHGHYDFSFTVDKNEPHLMKGHFVSGKGSPLSIEMKKID
ncbi:MAG: hypothetical protein V2B13_19860 [Pseudomonadota bacterium]